MTITCHFFGGPKDGAELAREDAPILIFMPRVVELPPPLEPAAPEEVIRYMQDIVYCRRGPALAGHAYYDHRP